MWTIIWTMKTIEYVDNKNKIDIQPVCNTTQLTNVQQFMENLDKTILYKKIVDKTVVDKKIEDKTIEYKTIETNQFKTFQVFKRISRLFIPFHILIKNLKAFQDY